MDKFKGNCLDISSAKAGSHNTHSQAPCLSIHEDGNQYVLDCLDNIESIQAIAAEWQLLEKTCGEPFIYFQTYDWCLKWCSIFSRPEEIDKQDERCGINIYILRRNNELVMVWPMMTIKSSFGLYTQTSLTEPHGQYANIICKRKMVPVSVGRKIWKHIRKSTKADAINLEQYPKDSFLSDIVGDSGVPESSEKFSSSMDLTQFDTWDEYRASLSRNMRKSRNQRRRKLSQLGEIKFEIHYGGSQRYAELLKLGIQWKNKWLKETGRRAIVLTDSRTREFIENLEGTPGDETKTPTGSIIGVLSVAERPIALEISFCEAGRLYSYLGAFDWELRKMSPGKLQLEEIQAWAKEEGFKTFDFLGEPAEYKSAWTNVSDELESRAVAISIKGFFYCVFWKAHIRPLLRAVFNRLKPNTRAKLLQFLGMAANSKPAIHESDERK